MKMGIDEDLSTSATMASLQKRNLGSSKRPKPINASCSRSRSVSTEELKLFHSIDRRLFTRLVLGLGRDPNQSAQIMALWMWIELNGNEPNLVYKSLMNLHNNVLSAMADESVWVLICIEESNVFPFHIVPDVILLQEMSSSRVTLRYFHQNRAKIAGEVTKLLLNVCLRVFDDLLLLQPYQERKAADDSQSNVEEGVNHDGRGFDPKELAVLRRSLNEELEEVLSHLCLDDDESQKVRPEERTIFLTFSKGHPVSQKEVWQFFTWKFGEIFDGIYMQQQVQEPCYARLVLRSASSIPLILDGKSIVTFIINGKHARARKFVFKIPTSSC